MFFDILNRDSLSWIWHKDLGEKISEDWTHCFCISRLTLRYFFINCFWSFCNKRCLARNHLHHENTKAPNVNFCTMFIASPEYFRSNVRWSSTIRIGPTILTFQLLCKTKINEFYVTPLQHRNDDVLRLEVPIDNIVWVQILKSQQHLCGIVSHIV